VTNEDVEAIRKRLAPKRVEIDGEAYWVAEGDLLLDADQLEEYARQQGNLQRQRALRQEATDLGMAPAPTTTVAELVAVAAGGKLVRWKDGKVLSYCILRNTFADEREYRIVRQSMEDATGAWERTCGVKFQHRASLDSSPTTRVDGVTFTVRKLDAGGRFIAAAFFPNDPPERRRIVIDPSFYADDLGFDRVGVLRHELGHVLGFRHEHIRSEAPAACPDEDLGEDLPLGAYDPKSVMHYFCGAVGSRELQISEVDVAGAQRLYGLPLSAYTFVE
jgi:hypothetical protein